MSYPAHDTERSRHPAANVFTLPRRPGVRPFRPAEQPVSFSEHVREILQRAADDLTLAVYAGEQGILILSSRDVTWLVEAEEPVRRALAAVEASRRGLLTHGGRTREERTTYGR